MPAWQLTQPPPLANFPDWQLLHVVARAGAYWPMGQALQADAPRPAWYFPAGQTTHAIAPPTENSPEGQAAQSEGSAEPGEATDVPAGHATQVRDCGTSW